MYTKIHIDKNKTVELSKDFEVGLLHRRKPNNLAIGTIWHRIKKVQKAHITKKFT